MESINHQTSTSYDKNHQGIRNNHEPLAGKKIALTFLGLALAGTGGLNYDISGTRADLNRPTGSRVEVMSPKITKRRYALEDLSPSKMVSQIKAAFGMNMIQLSQALKVERQTIYQWIDEEQPTAIHSKNKDRLNLLNNLSKEWNKICLRPVGKLLETLEINGSTLLKLLSTETLDSKTIGLALKEIATEINSSVAQKKNSSTSTRLISKGFQPPPEASLRSMGLNHLESAYGLLKDVQ